ncbi:MAG: PAS domain-containing protein [Fibrobacter sp.]|nr:PAS domain-containing protein [Fibrobacter sp.]
MEHQNDEQSKQEHCSRKIQVSKRELETVFDAIDTMICIVDNNLSIVRVNKKYAGFVGHEIKAILGKKCHEMFFNCDSQCADCPCLVTFQTGEAVVNKRFIKKNPQEIRYFEVKTFPVYDPSGILIHVIEFIKDVTDEKRMIEQLIRSEKLASIGVMTAGIAHEMNNPLSGISGTAVNLLEKPEKYGLNDKGISRVGTILESAARATVIMKDLLHLSKKNESVYVMVDLNRLLIKTINAVHLEGAGEIQKKFMLDESLPFVYCDPSRIDQVIMNVVTNAMQSVTEKKQQMSAEGKKYTGRIVVSSQKQAATALITIADNGIGINPDIRRRIFDPFFSTKPAGQGTGLGLSVSHRIIEEHRGRIYFDSIDETTKFSIELPLESAGTKIKEE